MARSLLLTGLVIGGAIVAYLVVDHGAPLPLNNPGDSIVGLPLPSGQGYKAVLALGAPESSGLGRWTGDFDADPPAKPFDFDGDGQMEVVAHSNDTHVYVFDSKTGRALATLTTTYPPGWHIERILNGVEVAKLTPDGPPSIIVANHAAFISRWDFTGVQQDGSFGFRKMWEKRMDTFYPQPGMDAKPVLADLEGKGQLDIVVVTEETGVYALRPDGSYLWKLERDGGNAEAAVGDLNGDGHPEVVIADDSGIVSAHDPKTGNWLWTFDAKPYMSWPASIAVAPTIADLDGKMPREVLFTARDAHAYPNITDDHMAVFAIHGENGKGKLVWKFQADWAAPLSYTHLVVQDVDHDGQPEVFGMDWNTIGHIPGNWETTGQAHVFALNHDGTQRWVRALDTFWSNKDLVLVDWRGDGKLDVLANGPSDTDGFFIFDASTGATRGFISVGGWKVERAPVVASLWGPATTQMLVAVRPLEDQGIPQGPLLVFDLGKKVDAPFPGFKPIWSK